MRKLWVSTQHGPALPFDVFNFDRRLGGSTAPLTRSGGAFALRCAP
jgi:hypothetical protein